MGHWVGELELRTMQITLPERNEWVGCCNVPRTPKEAYARSRAIGKINCFADARAGAVFIYKPLSNALELTASWGGRSPRGNRFFGA